MSAVKDEGFNHLLNKVAANIPDSMDGKKSGGFKLTLAILGILAFIGNEAVKVLFHKNFGMTKGAIVRLTLCFFSFGCIAVLFFLSLDANDSLATEYGSPGSHLVMGIFYSVLAVTILIKGIAYRNKFDEHNVGDSTLLSFLKKDGWSQKKIQNIAEPLFVIILGATICLFDLIGGLPIIFCALSTWANILFEQIFQNSSLQERVSKLNTQSNPKSDFHEINTD